MDTAYDIARQLVEAHGNPTVIVPLEIDGHPGLGWASYDFSRSILAQAVRTGSRENQALLAIGCCIRARRSLTQLYS